LSLRLLQQRIRHQDSKETHQMKTAIVSSKDLTPECWSALRFVGGCEDCQRVMRCKLKEGTIGQKRVLRERIKKAKAQIRRWVKLLDKLENIS